MALPRASIKLLLTGASGYIGGSVLTQFLATSFDEIKNLSISVLVRKREHAEYFESIGVTPILFNDLSELDLLKKVASDHDVVIHTASSLMPAPAEALIEGLAIRKAATNNAVWYLHVSGASSIANRPATRSFIDTAAEGGEKRVFSDTDDIYAYEERREALEQYGQRTTDVTVVRAGEACGVLTYIVTGGVFYGRGTGHFHQTSVQIPWVMQVALNEGYVEFIGEGAEEWDRVHITDVARVFELLLQRLLRPDWESLPSGKRGFYFADAALFSWKEMADKIAKVGYDLGVLNQETARSSSLATVASKFPGVPPELVELALASRAVLRGYNTRELLGWKPLKGDEAWDKTFAEDWELVLNARK
ncbi:hypothetical protein F5884DRAFT_885201 [Xylogone sp. PMI_703]|nr:hypothetical protein F5884DRAFT_885201 [Xylogone sp. PMI_703]